MPIIHHADACPHCGGTEVTLNTMSGQGGQKTFACGEELCKSTDGTYFARYRCQTIPRLMQSYEECIAYATVMLGRAQITGECIRMLKNLCDAPSAVQIYRRSDKKRANVLASFGFIEYPVQGTLDVAVATIWGRHALTQLIKRIV